MLQLAEKLASGEVSSVEATEACLARIEPRGPQGARLPRASTPSGALAARPSLRRAPRGAAAGSARRRARRAQGHLLHRRACSTTCGSRILEGFVPPYDATVRRALLQGAGAVLLGQAEHGRVRHGLVHRELRLRPDAQPLGSGRACPAAPRAARAAAVAARRGASAPSAPTPAAPSASRRRSRGTVGLKPTYGRVLALRRDRLRLARSIRSGPSARTVADCGRCCCR